MINPDNDGNFASETIQGNPDDVSVWKLAPQIDWRGMSDSEHFVQFYGEDGYSLIGKLRAMENLKHTPAVALTAYVRVEDRTRALSAGFNMFVPKPVGADRVNCGHCGPDGRSLNLNEQTKRSDIR